jgi:hypothetical protein
VEAVDKKNYKIKKELLLKMQEFEFKLKKQLDEDKKNNGNNSN